MRSHSLFFASLLLLTHAFATPVYGNGSPSAPHESISKLPEGWSFHSDAAEDDAITLRLALKSASNSITEIAHAVSDPENPRYGQHLSADDLRRIKSPSSTEACDTVSSWLESHDVHVSLPCDGEYVRFTTSVSNANRMLRSTFSRYQLDDQDPVLRTQEYTLPDHLAEHVDFVFPTVHFLSAARKPKTTNSMERRQHGVPDGPVSCANSICPQNLTQMYNITYYPKDSSSGSKIGIAGFIRNFPNRTDVLDFLATYPAHSQNHSIPPYTVKSVNKGQTTMSPEPNLVVEPNLDLDYSMAFTGPLPAIFYSVGGSPPELTQPGNKPTPESDNDNEPYLDFLASVLAEKNPPQVISMSYSDNEQSVPIRYAQHVCSLMAQAAARGISVIGSSGDGGVQGAGVSDCIGPDGKHRFIPTFPSSCPWQTSVGSTASYGGPASFTAGGFSNYFAIPKWQAAAVSHFLKENNGTNAGLFNTSGRGIPDISIIGDSFLVPSNGYLAQNRGTSASTPVFAAMIALANDLRLRAGKPTLGHLNPLLYSSKFAAAIRDVISEYGLTNGCSDADFTAGGWTALPGWDPASGLGEPNFEVLKKLFLEVGDKY